MKRILLYIFLLFGAGCKVLQPPGYRTDQPEASHQVKPEEIPLVTTDTRFPETKKTIDSLAEKTEQLVSVLDSLALAGEDVPYSAINEGVADTLPDSLLSLIKDMPVISDTIPKKKGTLEAVVDYKAKDSIIWTSNNMAFLFGDGDVKYQNIGLKSQYIQMDMDKSQLIATHGIDSVGNAFGHPVFSQENNQDMEAKEMNYNFKTKRATAKNVVTKQGEGHIIAEIAKKMDDDVINMAKGKYTTCDEIDHPHFYIGLSKAKVRAGKSVVSGPAWLVIEDVPLPAALPFAWFPFTDTYSSGIIMPTYGDEMNRGFFLRNGGYYLALSDYFDLAITGEVYTKGSWGVTGQTSYRKRYKYSGNISLSTLTTVTGDKGLDDYSKQNDFKVKISHTQDPKANPFQTISASVDYSSSSYDRKQLNSLYTPAATQNNKGSSVSYSRKFPNSPFNLTATMTINQRTQDSSVTVTLPDMTFTMARIYPFKRKSAIGKDRWYEKISVNYNTQIRNSISTKEDLLFKSNFVKDWKNGINHKADINATYSILEVINISPNFSYQERWYSHRIEKEYDPKTKKLMPTDTIYGFNRSYNFNGSISASTTLYGMFIPWKPFQKYVKAIRHRMDPSISFSAQPDFGDPRYGSYRNYMFTNGMHLFPDGRPDTVRGYYSPFDGQIFSYPGRGKSGSVSFSLDNNIEAKIVDKNETSGERKISLIDKLSGSIGYNLAIDSIKWTDLNTNLRIKLSKSYTVNLNMLFDTYMYDEKGTKINVTRFEAGRGLGKIGRLKSTGTSYSYTFDNNTIKKWFGGGDENKTNNRDRDTEGLDENEYDPNNPDDLRRDTRTDVNTEKKGSLLGKKKEKTGDYDEHGYYNNAIQWSFSINYNLSMSYNLGKFDPEKREYAYKFINALSFSGNLQPTKNWRLTLNATYDFEHKKISYATCNITRSMHCWQMSASVIPIGPMKSYSFSISANASMLKDLKWDQRSSPYNNQAWY